MGAGEGVGEGSGKGRLCPGLIWSFCWFVVLIVIGWPLAFFIAWLYILLLPFSACIEPVKGVCESILKVVQLPYTCAEGISDMKPLCK